MAQAKRQKDSDAQRATNNDAPDAFHPLLCGMLLVLHPQCERTTNLGNHFQTICSTHCISSVPALAILNLFMLHLFMGQEFLIQWIYARQFYMLSDLQMQRKAMGEQRANSSRPSLTLRSNWRLSCLAFYHRSFAYKEVRSGKSAVSARSQVFWDLKRLVAFPERIVALKYSLLRSMHHIPFWIQPYLLLETITQQHQPW